MSSISDALIKAERDRRADEQAALDAAIDRLLRLRDGEEYGSVYGPYDHDSPADADDRALLADVILDEHIVVDHEDATQEWFETLPEEQQNLFAWFYSLSDMGV